MVPQEDRSTLTNFRKFFVRGLAILLPSILTIWILLAAYNFVSDRIAEPINRGVRELVIRLTYYPPPDDLDEHKRSLGGEDRATWKAAGGGDAWIERHSRRKLLEEKWKQYAFPFDLIGLLVACFLFYLIGGLVGSYVGGSVLRYFEGLLRRVPGVKQIYPYVKQVTDFLVGEGKEKLKFNKVVAVEYPRKGIWSVGLVTGQTMRSIQDRVQDRCVTVFVPSSPTPFTGYVITVPEEDMIDLGISIEEALRFAVSGGVIVPLSQQIPTGAPALAEPLSAERSPDSVSAS